jgi:hypothetical protein
LQEAYPKRKGKGNQKISEELSKCCGEAKEKKKSGFTTLRESQNADMWEYREVEA